MARLRSLPFPYRFVRLLLLRHLATRRWLRPFRLPIVDDPHLQGLLFVGGTAIAPALQARTVIDPLESLARTLISRYSFSDRPVICVG
jgi:hypothetical protein